MAKIIVDKLTFGYGGKSPVFRGFDWQVESGEAWAVVGPSGCGKSTLLCLLAGLSRPENGSVAIDGGPIQRPRPKTGLVLQDHGLLPWATVSANARLGLTIRKFYGPDDRHAPADETVDDSAADQRVVYWLDRLGIGDLAGRYPARLSRGQRQRAAIARTLVLEPDLLLLDEPFSALDAPTREDLQRLALQLHKETGMTQITVTHDIEEAVVMGEKILVLTGKADQAPRIVVNPSAGDPRGRHTPRFRDCHDQLREMLGGLT